MEWMRITVTTTSESADLVSMLLWENGSNGVAVTDKHDVEEILASKDSWDYADDSLTNMTDERVFVSGFFPADFGVDALMAALEDFRISCLLPTGSLETSVSVVKDADWENEWKKYYEPIEIENAVIVPKWLKYDGNCAVRILMDPGMAFGTGRHETTAMCIALLQHIDVRGKDVLDVGCGSGILGVSALKLGAKRSVMSDIDSRAVDSARENTVLNGVADRAEFVLGDLDCSHGTFDVVLANITADILLRLHSALGPFVSDGGNVIISGLIHARADEVLAAYSEDFRLVERVMQGEWQTMLLKKK